VAPGEPDRLYLVEQAGIIRVLEHGAVLAQPFLDIRRLVKTSPKETPAGEQGLLSVAFAPDYPSSGRLYVDYTDLRGRVVVAEYQARDGHADPASARVLLVVPKTLPRHEGGQLQFGPDGGLYAAVGDDTLRYVHAQRLDGGDRRGKILRHDPSRPGDGWRIVAYGLRNPWRFSFDHATGQLWIADVGEASWEEISVVPREDDWPVNLGWPAYEGHEAREGELDGSGELVWPVAVYGRDAGCAVVGGYVYRGREIAGLRGRYVYGDFCTGRVWSLDPATPGDVRLELDLPVTLASFGEDAAGELYLVSRTGRMFRLAVTATRRRRSPAARRRPPARSGRRRSRRRGGSAPRRGRDPGSRRARAPGRQGARRPARSR
jgi:glucose/arabinose dehydrogenase